MCVCVCAYVFVCVCVCVVCVCGVCVCVCVCVCGVCVYSGLLICVGELVGVFVQLTLVRHRMHSNFHGMKFSWIADFQYFRVFYIRRSPFNPSFI